MCGGRKRCRCVLVADALPHRHIPAPRTAQLSGQVSDEPWHVLRPDRRAVVMTLDEVAVLKGNPARVEDSEKGNTEGGRLTLSIRDSKVTADDTRGPLSPGRIRTTHKIKKP